MQINIALEINCDEQAATIRSIWYPTTTARQTRVAFIFNECIDKYKATPEDLLPYIEKDEGSTTVQQRKLTIKSESYDRLHTIALAINKPLSATYRAIIAYTIDHLVAASQNENVVEPVGVSQLLMEKIALLNNQLEACNQTLKEITKLTE